MKFRNRFFFKKKKDAFHWLVITDVNCGWNLRIETVYDLLLDRLSLVKTGITLKFMTGNKNFFVAYVTNVRAFWPNWQKLPNVTLVFKKIHLKCKKDQRSVNILSLISKRFGCIICNQLSAHFNVNFFKD